MEKIKHEVGCRGTLPEFAEFMRSSPRFQPESAAALLGPQLGLCTDAYQRYGYFTDEIFRAVRLVVDPAIHVKGWTRQQAIDYMLRHTAFSRRLIEIEVDRYISAPAQALAYKIGELTIQRLRSRAKEELGEKFDVREFHEEMLSTGSLPMSVLENKIEHWIAARRSH